MILAEHLKLNPRSRVFAMASGGMQYKDWTPTTEVTAGVYDAIVALIHGLGGGEGDAPRFPRPESASRPAPDASETDETPFQTIAEFSLAGFAKFMYG
ncbi:hypothetical protein MN032_11145 [Agromyces atrinae]|uniref:hypothetical protein n=1 Tax=Agromyces atrinae TaxID=592376 RepID=UPI001F596211|nr:hypothetical protein [Agromyces atrinae]MCI2958254.1 hypothetical protein [Agromyces atrinae]